MASQIASSSVVSLSSSPEQPSSIATELSRIKVEQSSLNKSLDDLRGTMEFIRATLLDAEHIEIVDDAVKDRLRYREALANDIEDVLDRHKYEMLRAKAENEVQVRDSTDLPLSLEAPVLRLLESRTTELQKRICEIMEQEGDRVSGDYDEEIGYENAKKKGLVEEKPKDNRLVGREEDLKELVRLLLVPDEELDVDVDGVPVVVAVVGMGGVGKTSLVRKVYDDKRVCEHFGSNKGWMDVHEEGFVDVVKVTKEAVKALTRKSCKFEYLDPIQHELKEAVEGKRFLLVLDDIWSEDFRVWETFKSALRFGGRGSRVLITTRDQPVAHTMQAIRTHHLMCLSHDDSWSLFELRAFVSRKPYENPDLFAIGKEIVEKCKGLPLSLEVLGGLLLHEDREEMWRNVLKSGMWEISGGEQILESLKLSYVYLPTSLKPCFVRCAAFPKGHKISKKELIQLWIAYGLCKDEQIGMGYISDLLSRSFVQPCPLEVKETKVVMHDLIHDLALYISEQQSEQIETDDWSLSVKIRCASLWNTSRKNIQLPSFGNPHGLRTLLLFGNRPLRIEILRQTYTCLEFLRVLDLNGSTVTTLPDLIGNLRLLRYLKLGCNNHIQTLPESTCMLYCLQQLDLCATIIKELPRGIGKLANLHYILMDGENRISYMPVGIGRLINLHTLEWFPVGRNAEHAGVEELQHLDRLRGCLSITGLCNVVRAQQAKAAKIKNKEYIQELGLDWKMKSEAEYVVQEEEEEQVAKQDAEVLDNLQPHVNLEGLTISNYSGSRFANWLMNKNFVGLVRLNLHSCRKCMKVSDLGGLPFLMLLHIEWMPSLEEVDHCTGVTRSLRHFSQGFSKSRGPRRRKLVIRDCANLTSLRVSVLELEIEKCENLESIHFQGKSMIYLKISDCPQLHFSSQSQLPSVIKSLEVDSCPLLNTWCHQPKGVHQIDEIRLDGDLLDKRSA